MATLNLEAPWDEVKYLLLEAESSLSEEDVQFHIPGEDDQLINKLAKKLNRTDDQIKGWIESVSHTTGLAG